MQTDKDNTPKRDEQPPSQAAVQNINLNDYAGDEEDNRSAREQANNYSEDLEHKNVDKATREE